MSPCLFNLSHTPAACSFPGENARSWEALGEARPGQSSLSAGALRTMVSESHHEALAAPPVTTVATVLPSLSDLLTELLLHSPKMCANQRVLWRSRLPSSGPSVSILRVHNSRTITLAEVERERQLVFQIQNDINHVIPLSSHLQSFPASEIGRAHV